MSGRHKVGDNAPSTKETTTPRAPARPLQTRRREPNFPRLGFKVLSSHKTPKRSYNAWIFRLSNFVGGRKKKKFTPLKRKRALKQGWGWGGINFNFSCHTTTGIHYSHDREVSKQPEAGACGPLGDQQPAPVVPSPLRS